MAEERSEPRPAHLDERASSARPAKPDHLDEKTSLARRAEEEKLAQVLVSRGLLTAEELKTCRSGEGPPGPEGLASRLVAAGLLTRGQARRALQDLTQGATQMIPGYQLLEKLGQGAMGVVYRARQLSLDRLVAVKLLHAKLAANADFLQRFRREALLAARLSHNNVVQAIDVGSAGALHYFVMELVEGKTIKQELDTGRVFEEREAVEIVLQVAQALAHAHRRGLIHRDVKPANIVRTAEGVAKLADLGLARGANDRAVVRGERGLVIGTPYYIAPEQIESRPDVDQRADLYSLGATLYHMVTGRPPFPGKDVEKVLDDHLEAELVPPDHLNEFLSSGLGEVVEVMMARDRKKRYQNADDLVIDLECLLAGEAPKLARKKMEEGMLEALAEGEEEEEPEALHPPEGPKHAWVWIGVLGGLLGLSLLLNLVMLLRRH
jgi:serine/threonine-protein kinase